MDCLKIRYRFFFPYIEQSSGLRYYYVIHLAGNPRERSGGSSRRGLAEVEEEEEEE